LAAASDLEASSQLIEPGGRVHDLMGATPSDEPERYALANPIRRLPLGVPILLVHGDADETVPLRRSRDFAPAARAAGDDVELVEVRGADHRGVTDPRTDAWAPTTSWLAGLGWL
jgi:dipeptidyl aminopeptidase/acylaminoacyl peptidase